VKSHDAAWSAHPGDVAVNVDFSVFFVAAAAVTGLIWLVEVAIQNSGRSGRPAFWRWLVAQARSLFPIILIVLLVRSFLVEPFRIPSASMMPGLVDGDFIFVNKFTYGLRLPILNTKIVPIGEPRRGDVIVFRLPSNPSVDFIKRLVGLPGDHVLVHDNRLFINDRPVPLIPDGTYKGDYGFTGAPLAIERFGAAGHVVMFARGRIATDYDATVPAGHYFFMGDNRNDSEDSRFPVVGFVPEQNLVGRAVRIWMNWRNGWPDWRRIGMKIL
jgi:signal peptidase I